LNIPVVYLSRYIVRTKPDYYRLLHEVRETDSWETWVAYMLNGVEQYLQVSRLTATKYLEALVDGGFLQKQKAGRSNYCINASLYSILTRDSAV